MIIKKENKNLYMHIYIYCFYTTISSGQKQLPEQSSGHYEEPGIEPMFHGCKEFTPHN